MRVGFYIHNLGLHLYLPITVLIGVLKNKGHEVRLWNGRHGLKAVMADIKSFKPDLIGYSICSNEVETYLAVNKKLKAEIPFVSIFGGPHPTFFPDFIKMELVDIICVGEGEEAILELLDRWETDEQWEIKNLHFKKSDGTIIRNPLRPLISNLDTLPFPDRDLSFASSPLLGELPIKTFSSNRGCPYNCSYCFNHKYNRMYQGLGKIMRHKSVRYFLDEIKDTVKKYPTSFIRFHDDVFGSDKKWLQEFAEKYPKEIGIPFSCFTRPNMVNDEYAQILARTGCVSVYIGIECGNENMRLNLLRRNMTDKQIISACESLHKANIKICSLNMIGFPGETAEMQNELINLNWKCKSSYAEISTFQPFPGTDICEYTQKMGSIDESSVARVSGQFGRSILKWPVGMRERIMVLGRLFPVLVDHPSLYFIFRHPMLIKLLAFFQPLLDLFYTLYYGYFLQSRILPVCIPIQLKLKMLKNLLSSGRGK